MRASRATQFHAFQYWTCALLRIFLVNYFITKSFNHDINNLGPKVGVDFDGAITVHRVHDQARAFCYEVCFDLQHPHLIKLALEARPPMHFHPHQEEYIKVLSGTLGVQIEWTEYSLGPQDGELRVLPWTNHRLYPLLPGAFDSNDGGKTRFILAAEKSEEPFQLDDTFFQNWYGYQDEVVMAGGKFDIIQVMNMFDAGGSYLTFPTWIPFSRRMAQLVGIMIGRWLGGLLGYQPFHRKWTTNWPAAAQKMETSIFLRRFVSQVKSIDTGLGFSNG